MSQRDWQDFCGGSFLLWHLQRLGLGSQLGAEAFLSANPRLNVDTSSAMESLVERLSANSDFFDVLREVAIYIFSRGEQDYEGSWRETYEAPGWEPLIDNPGMLADSWMASLSSEFRRRVGLRLLERLTGSISERRSELDYEFWANELRGQSMTNQVRIALNLAKVDGLLVDKMGDFTGLYSFRAEPFIEICLAPMPFNESFFADLTTLATSYKYMGRRTATEVYKDHLLQVDSCVLRSRLLWALALLVNSGRHTAESAAERLVKTDGIQTLPEDGSSLEACLVVAGRTLTSVGPEPLRQLARFVCAIRNDGASYETLRPHLVDDSLPTTFAVFCRWCDYFAEWPEVRENIERWLATGLNPTEAIHWFELGSSSDEVKQWLATGLNPTEAFQWFRLGVTPHDAAVASQAGLQPGEAPRNLRDAGLDVTPENLSRWRHLDYEKILDAIGRGFTSAEEYLPFAAGSLNRENVDRLRESAPDDILDSHLQRFEELLEAGVSNAFAAKFAGFERLMVKQVLELDSLGLDSDLVATWCRSVSVHATRLAWLRMKPPIAFQDAEAWISMGLKPKDYLQYRELFAEGITSAEAASWARLGVSPHDVRRWRELGVSPDVAREWEARDLGPSDYKASTERGPSPRTVAD